MGVYDIKPDRLLERLFSNDLKNPISGAYCAGFELEQWRCIPLAHHLIEWLPEYALIEEELGINHGNSYVKLREAAIRVYTSKKYERRGEAGEIALHAICREYFDTIPISPRVFYKSATNDVVKSFDMVHARFPTESKFELWLGESKLHATSAGAITDAIKSINLHLDQGFLTNQKLLLGPQVPKSTPNYSLIREVFKSQASLDKFMDAAVFVVGVAAKSNAASKSKTNNVDYSNQVRQELEPLISRLNNSSLPSKIRIVLIYIPLGSKIKLVTEFDRRLKALQ